MSDVGKLLLLKENGKKEILEKWGRNERIKYAALLGRRDLGVNT